MNAVRQQKLAGSLASPANEIATCRCPVRERQLLAPAAAAPRCAASRACDRRNNGAANANATTDAAAAGPAACATSAATATSAAAASSAPAASSRKQHAAQGFFIAGEVEGGEIHVGEFLLAERTELAGRDVQFLWRLVCRHRGCHRASRQRKSQSGKPECRDCSFGDPLLVGSLLRPLHGRILQVGRTIFSNDPTPGHQTGQDSREHEMVWRSFRLHSSS